MAGEEEDKSERWHTVKRMETGADGGREGGEEGKEEQSALLNGNWLSH